MSVLVVNDCDKQYETKQPPENGAVGTVSSAARKERAHMLTVGGLPADRVFREWRTRREVSHPAFALVRRMPGLLQESTRGGPCGERWGRSAVQATTPRVRIRQVGTPAR